MKKFHPLTALLLSALLLLTPALGLGETAGDQTAAQIISEYTKLDLNAYEGKAIYLNFFTKWCPYCMQELPDIKKIFEEYSADELQIVLVHVWDGETAKESEEIKAEYGLEDMFFFEDEDGLLSRMVGLEGYPLSVLIAKDGSVYGVQSGAISYRQLASAMDDMGVAKKEAAK